MLRSELQLTIPYLDPCLPLATRKNALKLNYGFICTCSLCTFQQTIEPLSPLPSNSDVIATLEQQLCRYISDELMCQDIQSPTSAIVLDGDNFRHTLPEELHPLLNPEYLPSLSETFSRASHEGDIKKALSSGKTLLAFYILLYPKNYPQTGTQTMIS